MRLHYAIAIAVAAALLAAVDEDDGHELRLIRACRSGQHEYGPDRDPSLPRSP